MTGAEATAILDRMTADRTNTEKSSFYVIRESRDFYRSARSEGELEALHDEFAAEYSRLLQEMTGLWGPPAFEGSSEEALDAGVYYPGNPLVVAHWLREGVVAYVAWGHEDKEEPVFLHIGIGFADGLDN